MTKNKEWLETWDLIRSKGRIQRNCFAVGIRDREPLRSRIHCGRGDQQRIHIFERDRGRFSSDVDGRRALKAAAANRDLRSSGGRSGRRGKAADAEGYTGQGNDGDAGILR